MSRRRLFLLIPALLFGGFLVREAYRAGIAWLLYRGEYAILERLGPDEYFVPAVRAHTIRPRSSEALMAWARRRFPGVLPNYDILDLRMHSSRKVIAALKLDLASRIRRDDDAWSRLVAIDVLNGDAIVADTAAFEFGYESGLELELVDVDYDGNDEIMLSMFGTGQTGRLFRLREGRFEQIRSDDHEGDFSSWTGFWYDDAGQADEQVIRGLRRAWKSCDCGKESQADVVTWKFSGGIYHRWTIRPEDCGYACERPWAN